MKTQHTFDQGHIQEDSTGTFFTAICVTVRCRAFSGRKIARNRILITRQKTIKVWDAVAGHYTACHDLSRATQLRIIRAHVHQ
jgi:hypothetical protein